MVAAVVLSAALITLCTAFAQVIHIAWKRGFDAGVAQTKLDAEREVMNQVLAALSKREGLGEH